MKILKVVANNFKLCQDNFTISFVAEANKTEDDKEFELHEVAPGLFTFTTVGIIGKNASGKTTVVDLMGLIYDIFSNFRVKTSLYIFKLWDKPINLDITFYHNGYLYRYLTDLVKREDSVDNTSIIFKNQKLYKRFYYKSYAKSLFDYEKFERIENTELPADTSIIYNLFKTIDLRGFCRSSDETSYLNYASSFNIYKILDSDHKILNSILKMFDEHLNNIEMVNENKFKIHYSNKRIKEVSSKELYEILSSGTTKGFNLFTFVVYSLKNGTDLVIDEIENHFHKTLVENLINLYKDKSVNKKNATLIFTTHYCELLDLFNRSDNIFITKYEEKIILENVYKDYNFRPELSKSKKFYNNAFNTDVNYDSLMAFKRELMK